MNLERYLRGIRATFNNVVLGTPRPGQAAPAAVDAAVYRDLLAWCHAGAGPGGAPSPGERPQVQSRMAVARLVGADHAWVTAFANRLACDIDGSLRLQALAGTLPRLAWRAQVKFHDACWWRQRLPSDPWDAGWASTSPPGLRQWLKGFHPRRATLVLADAADAPALTVPLAMLLQFSDVLPHPVRWLWVGADLPNLPDRLDSAACAVRPRFSLAGRDETQSMVSPMARN